MTHWCRNRRKDGLCITEVEVYIVIVVVLVGGLVIILLAIRFRCCRGRVFRGRGSRRRLVGSLGGRRGASVIVVPWQASQPDSIQVESIVFGNARRRRERLEMDTYRSAKRSSSKPSGSVMAASRRAWRPKRESAETKLER